MKTTMLTAALLTLAADLHAHQGHGLPDNAHWHASDAWGFALLGAVVAAAVWFQRRK